MTWEQYKAKAIPGRLEASLKGENPDDLKLKLSAHLQQLIKEYA